MTRSFYIVAASLKRVISLHGELGKHACNSGPIAVQSRSRPGTIRGTVFCATVQ
jgi:hypothetical protein